ncbi:hypothetical protein KUCAC02_029813, partial [Chaenocephalus aceratus]
MWFPTHRLTENMRRLKRGLKPLSNFKRNLTALSSWYSIYTSAIAFIVSSARRVYAGIKVSSSSTFPSSRGCPKLRQRFDTPFIIWTHLPTDLPAEGARRLHAHQRVTLSSGRGSVGPAAPLGASRDEDGGRYSSTKRGAFHEVFNLQESERPLTVCESGWRCCLINRDRKSPTDYIRNGYLYVTENHLCFESSSSRSGSSKRNKVIKLADITDIQKYKVLSVLPGSGSGISIATPSTTK